MLELEAQYGPTSEHAHPSAHSGRSQRRVEPRVVHQGVIWKVQCAGHAGGNGGLGLTHRLRVEHFCPDAAGSLEGRVLLQGS